MAADALCCWVISAIRGECWGACFGAGWDPGGIGMLLRYSERDEGQNEEGVVVVHDSVTVDMLKSTS